jgi:hypothetical protein
MIYHTDSVMYFTEIVPHFCYPPGHMGYVGRESEGHHNPAENPELAAYVAALQQYEAQFDKAETDPMTLVSLADYIDLLPGALNK